jgi:hypothetical protein
MRHSPISAIIHARMITRSRWTYQRKSWVMRLEAGAPACIISVESMPGSHARDAGVQTDESHVLRRLRKGPRDRTLPDPTPGEDGVVIAVGATGLCRSDWHGWMGHDPDIKLPHVPGHELAGKVWRRARA